MKLNNINISRIYIGEVCIENIYIGNQLVYSQSCIVEPSVSPSILPPEPSTVPSTPPTEPSTVPSEPEKYYCIIPILSGSEVGACLPDYENSYCIYADSSTVATITKCIATGPYEDLAECVTNCAYEEPPTPLPCPSPCPCPSPLVSTSPLPTSSFVSTSQPISSTEPSTPIYLGGDVQTSQTPAPTSYY